MATWTTIPDSSLEPGKPIRSIDALALRDNPVAIAEGQSGAPRIVDAALDTTATNTGRDWVLNRTALAAVGAVGTYAFLHHTTDADYSPGSTLAGSSLRYAGIGTNNPLSYTTTSVSGTDFAMVNFSTAPSGTWMCMGVGSNINITTVPANARIASVWLRIA